MLYLQKYLRNDNQLFESNISNSVILLWGVMAKSDLPKFIRDNYEVHERRHACAILEKDFLDEWNDIISILKKFRLYRSHILAPGGRKSQISEWFEKSFSDRSWKEKKFVTKYLVENEEKETKSHKIDCFKNRIAVEVEWSNKDPFFDRDLHTFSVLFDVGSVSVGVIITKSNELREIMESLGKPIWKKYGTSTTWMNKLLPRIKGGGGGGCPLLVFGIKKSLYVEDTPNGK